MAIIKSFRDLIAYQKARAAAKEVFKLTKRFPAEERYSLTDQIRRPSRRAGSIARSTANTSPPPNTPASTRCFKKQVPFSKA